MEINISKNEEDQRLDRFLRKLLKENSDIKLSDIYSWIRKGAIKVNNTKKRENYRLKLNDKIVFSEKINLEKNPVTKVQSKSQQKRNIDLDFFKKNILFEDENWIFFDKPIDIAVHPWTRNNKNLTLKDYLEEYIKSTNPSLISKTFSPSFWFRLDKNTSWIIVAAKTYESLKFLNYLIKNRKTYKEYLTIVKWTLKEKENIDFPLSKIRDNKSKKSKSIVDKKNWKTAYTEVFPISQNNIKKIWNISLISVIINTWRFHQIRAHLSAISYPIIGDILYNSNDEINNTIKKDYKITRPLLHSYKYWFFDKFKNKNISITSPYPKDFIKFFPENDK